MQFHDLTISSVTHETPDSVAISFDVPADLADVFQYQPGQYLTIRHEIDGEELRRSYSIASGPHDPLTIGVKRVDGGIFSTIAQQLKPGDTLQVSAPDGRFVLKDARRILLVAAGSGITPMVAIAAHALERGTNVTLIYGNRDTSHIMFRDRLEALKDKHLAEFSLIHVLSREEQDVPLLNGHVSGEKVIRLANAGVLDLADTGAVYLCGPGEMIDDVQAHLLDHGVPPQSIHHERFAVEGAPAPKPRSEAAESAAEAGVDVEVILDGSRRRFILTEADDTVLAAAARNGLELPYSCKGGMCCTCRCRIAEGTAEMATNYSLEPWELEAGFTLACQTRPTSEKLVLDFDAA